MALGRHQRIKERGRPLISIRDEEDRSQNTGGSISIRESIDDKTVGKPYALEWLKLHLTLGYYHQSLG